MPGRQTWLRYLKNEWPQPLSRLRLDEKGEVSLSVHCQHCDDAPCIQACLTGAIQREHGSSLVKVDEERCVGCWTCMLVCPLGMLRQDRGKMKMVKCDLCEREEIPACVAQCPNEASVCVEVEDISTDLRDKVIANIK
ncbi:4Fe-4S dicluster domain-containing protein [Chloroflexota bacterium]